MTRGAYSLGCAPKACIPPAPNGSSRKGANAGNSTPGLGLLRGCAKGVK